jgi:ubiquinone/menaquinone biosynthesis C-methylase UbiE
MNQNNPTIDWNDRFSRQAEWTKPLRDFLSKQLGITHSSSILEVGCGTGVILRDLHHCIPFGVDIDFSRLRIASELGGIQHLSCADGYSLPFPSNTFDFMVFHYLLLWIKRPQSLLSSILRVLKPGGAVIAFAEPDYQSRIEYPDEFEQFGTLQTNSLIQQGIDARIGRKLPGLLSSAGFKNIQYGISGFQNQAKNDTKDIDSEWTVLKEDLRYTNSQVILDEYKKKDEYSRSNGSRVSWVPTFYAFGTKPD